MDREKEVNKTFRGMDQPRIRHITGIRIHHLALPEPSVSSLLRSSSPPVTPSATLFPESSSSNYGVSPTLPRRPSHRERSISSSTITTSPSAYRTRGGTIVGRARAPTLAGEALELAKSASGDVREEIKEFKAKRLARTFLVLRLPSEDEAQTSRKGKEKAVGYGSCSSGTTSNSSRDSKAQSSRSRPSLSTNSSHSSSSFSSPPSSGRSTPTTTPVKEKKAAFPNGRPLKNALSRNGSHDRPSTMRRSSSLRLDTNGVKHANGDSQVIITSPSPPLAKTTTENQTSGVPFFISPIHPPSTNPQVSSLEEGDFAPWLSVDQFASHKAVLEVWYESDPHTASDCDHPEKGLSRWEKADELCRVLDLRNLRRVDKDTRLLENSVVITLSTDPRSTFYFPHLSNEAVSEVEVGSRKRAVSGVMERSRRETRMKKGIGLGGLHQLVNMQAVIADTQKSIAEVQRKIDKLLLEDVTGGALRRSVNETESRVKWLQGKVVEVERNTEEVHARTTLRRQDLAGRRTRLEEAEVADHLLRSRLSDLSTEINTAENDRSSLLPAIHHTRSQHVQALDALFPISPLHPPSLLYSILDIPLPIPLGPKDPAPPLTMTLPKDLSNSNKIKVDERTTAAALGYVGLLVQILGNLSGVRKEGGLSYPITCAGSRSLVKDTVSIMQGPRSFPLFAKGVERYRYEYAVFLLNKNIEMLMQEASIRLLDLRHTLPNLKALLLTLSSPTPPPPRRPPAPAMQSRQTSAAYSIPKFSPSRSSPSSTRVGGYGSGPVSPVPRGVGRSRLGSVVKEARGAGSDDEDAGAEEAGTETETETEVDSVDRSSVVSPY